MANDKEVKEFQAFIVEEAKSKGKKPEDYAKELGEDGLKKAYQRFVAYKQKKAQKALHGAKLNYFKSLKHQCAEDEEVVYYKRGGSVDCGCKKKEEGGEIPKSEAGWKANFKARKMQKAGTIPPPEKRTKEQQKEIDRKSQEDYDRGYGDHNVHPSNYTKKQETKKKELPKNNKNNIKMAKSPKVSASKGGSKIEKNCGGAVVKAFKAARCGAKMKKK